MRVPDFIRKPLARWLRGKLERGELKPHKYGNIATKAGGLYMERGWLFEPAWWTFGVGARVHRTVRSDADRDLHDHPWWNVSVILDGFYYELVPTEDLWYWQHGLAWDNGRETTDSHRREPGDVVFRAATDRHRLIVADGTECLSLFIMGPWRQVWGFYPESGKVLWREYLGLPPSEDGR